MKNDPMQMDLLEKTMQENCDMVIPTKWNIYRWIAEHPKTTIAAAVKRLEKIFDLSDCIQFSFSGGKDSTVTANLACLELNLRKLRVKNGIDRDGNPGVDPLDKKWANRRIHGMMTDAEVVFTSTNEYSKRFLEKYGPEGLDLIEFNWACLPLAWQSGVSFDSGILISWDPNKRDMWVQGMPTKSDLHGFECIRMENLNTANAVALSDLHPEAQRYHAEMGNVVKIMASDLFGSKVKKGSVDDVEVEAVANYGRGPILPEFKPGCHEKEEQDDYSYEFCKTAWLVSEWNPEERKRINESAMNRHDMSKNVWFLKANKDGVVPTALVSLRAEESLDRRVILSQGEYSTGQYSRNQGTNICSPVFDFTTADIWRLLSITDWDVNDVYEKLYEIGVGIGDQRVGSLLNYAAVRQVATVKSLEPELYGRINQRFSNVEFMAQFSRSSYYRISKPKDSHWDGKNHIKAGVAPEEIKRLSDGYEDLLKTFNIPYRRDGNEFWTEDPACKGKPWFPFKELADMAQSL